MTRLIAIITIAVNNPMMAGWLRSDWWLRRYIPVQSKQEAGEALDRAIADYPTFQVVARVEHLQPKQGGR